MQPHCDQRLHPGNALCDLAFEFFDGRRAGRWERWIALDCHGQRIEEFRVYDSCNAISRQTSDR